MKGYCPRCGKELDEVEFVSLKMCYECYEKKQEKESTIVERKDPDKVYDGLCKECNETKEIVFTHKGYRLCLDCFKVSEKGFSLFLDWYSENEIELTEFMDKNPDIFKGVNDK